MTHEEIKENLSAYFDGQLGPAETVEISAHVSACPGCRAALDELSRLSAGVKKNLSAAAPAAMKERVLATAGAKKPLVRTSTVLAAALAAIILALMAGIVAKRVMPVMFAQIQGMISAASSTLGASGGNE